MAMARLSLGNPQMSRAWRFPPAFNNAVQEGPELLAFPAALPTSGKSSAGLSPPSGSQGDSGAGRVRMMLPALPLQLELSLAALMG